MLLLIGVTSVVRMPVDLFPRINLPEAVVATFYNGMPPEDIETDITDPLERFFTLASGVEHMESRSLPGVSIIKVFFDPSTSADVTQLSNLALSDLKRLPPETLLPCVEQLLLRTAAASERVAHGAGGQIGYRVDTAVRITSQRIGLAETSFRSFGARNG